MTSSSPDNNGGLSQKGVLTDHGRRMMSKAVSAFANSGGGVLVLGVQTKGAFASEVRPISDLQRFHTQVQDFLPTSLDPTVAGIDSIRIEKSPDNGFVVIYIPEGQAKPHMATCKNHYTYYLRTESSSSVMPDRVVRAFVLARSAPELVVELESAITAVGPTTHRERETIRHWVRVRNLGTVVAKSIAVALDAPENYSFVDANGGLCFPEKGVNVQGLAVKVFRLNQALHPSLAAVIFGIDYSTVHSNTSDVPIRAWAYAEDFTGQEQALTLSFAACL